MSIETGETTHDQLPQASDIEGCDGLSGRGRRVTNTDFELAAENVGRNLRDARRKGTDTAEMEDNRLAIQHAIDALTHGSGVGDLPTLLAIVKKLATAQRCDLTRIDLSTLGKDGAAVQLAEWSAKAGDALEQRKASLRGQATGNTTEQQQEAIDNRLLSFQCGDPTMLDDSYIYRDLDL